MKSAYVKAQILQTLSLPVVKIVIILLVVGFITYFVLVIRYNIISAKRKKAKREKMRAMRQARRQEELEQMRQGVRVPSKDEAQAESASVAAHQEHSEPKAPITFEDFYNRTK
jgi:hypothetical protein